MTADEAPAATSGCADCAGLLRLGHLSGLGGQLARPRQVAGELDAQVQQRGFELGVHVGGLVGVRLEQLHVLVSQEAEIVLVLLFILLEGFELLLAGLFIGLLGGLIVRGGLDDKGGALALETAELTPAPPVNMIALKAAMNELIPPTHQGSLPPPLKKSLISLL